MAGQKPTNQCSHTLLAGLCTQPLAELSHSQQGRQCSHTPLLAGSAPAYIMWEGAGWGQPHVAGQKPAQLACALTHTHSLSRVDRSHSSTSPYSMQEEVARVQPNVAGQS